ncbi:MAG TPA: PIN domain-containing protein [Candidatus Binatia bacterium]|nr:PIN domain-containing protein [Candidatus Binatia bacterium]
MRPTLARAIFIVACGAAGAALAPSRDARVVAGAALGAVAGAVAVALEVGVVHAVRLQPLVWGTVGGMAGAIAGTMVGGTLAPMAGAQGMMLETAVAVVGAWVGGAIGVRRAAELPRIAGSPAPALERILDTSVIIDGRIADIAEAGFLDGALVVPQFVVRELQRLADNTDAVRRNRGRRGFEILERLRKSPAVRLTILDAEVAGVVEVDAKLVALARERGARLLTNDSALGRTAALAGVPAGSLHELALALKPVALPGETMQVQVLREGKEAGQGVAYLDDGTMVVVEGGKRHLGQTVEVVVTSALQTSAGRMIFTRPRENGGA